MMVRVLMASGEELASVPNQEVTDVGALKQWLRAHRGLPVCLQQLLYDGIKLADETELEEVHEVQLVISSWGPDVQTVSCTEFIDAACAGDCVAIRWFLKAGVPHDATDRKPVTALHIASNKGDNEVVRLLLDAGATPGTALELASRRGHIEIVRLLLQAAAAKNAVDVPRVTALRCASGEGHAKVVALLLEAGTPMDHQDDTFGWTALHLACRRGHFEVVRLLLRSGAAKDVMDASGKTALQLASEKGHVETVRLMLQAGAAKNTLDKDVGMSALRLASDAGHLQVADLPRGNDPKRRKTS